MTDVAAPPDGTAAPAPDGAAPANAAPAWIAQLPDDLKGNETFTGYKTIGDLAKDHLSLKGKATELEGKLATDFIPKLTDKSTTEQQAAFYKALGVPDKADEYEFTETEGIKNSPEMVNWARDAFHKAHLTKDQVAAIVPAWNTFVKGMETAQAEATTKAKGEAETKLKTDWGNDFDANCEVAKRAFTKFTNADYTAFLEETGVGNHPVLVKMFYEIGKAMGEGGMPPGTGGRGGGQPANDGVIHYDWNKTGG